MCRVECCLRTLTFTLILIASKPDAGASYSTDKTFVDRNLSYKEMSTNIIGYKMEKERSDIKTPSKISNKDSQIPSAWQSEISSLCLEDLSFPLSISDVNSTLWLEGCIKLIVLNTGNTEQVFTCYTF